MNSLNIITKKKTSFYLFFSFFYFLSLYLPSSFFHSCTEKYATKHIIETNDQKKKTEHTLLKPQGTSKKWMKLITHEGLLVLGLKL